MDARVDLGVRSLMDAEPPGELVRPGAEFQTPIYKTTPSRFYSAAMQNDRNPPQTFYPQERGFFHQAMFENASFRWSDPRYGLNLYGFTMEPQGFGQLSGNAMPSAQVAGASGHFDAQKHADAMVRMWNVYQGDAEDVG